MFDFQTLSIYKLAKEQNVNIYKFLKANKISYFFADQLNRATLSVTLNLAEGAGRYTKPSKRNFYIHSRGSIYECVAILDVMLEVGEIQKATYEGFISVYVSISKMLLRLIQSQR